MAKIKCDICESYLEEHNVYREGSTSNGLAVIICSKDCYSAYQYNKK